MCSHPNGSCYTQPGGWPTTHVTRSASSPAAPFPRFDGGEVLGGGAVALPPRVCVDVASALVPPTFSALSCSGERGDLSLERLLLIRGDISDLTPDRPAAPETARLAGRALSQPQDVRHVDSFGDQRVVGRRSRRCCHANSALGHCARLLSLPSRPPRAWRSAGGSAIMSLSKRRPRDGDRRWPGGATPSLNARSRAIGLPAPVDF